MSMMDSFNETLQSELANKGQGVPVARDQQVTELAEFMGRLSGGLRHFAGQIIDAGWTMRSTPSAIPVGFRDPEFSWATISAENKARMEGLGHDLSCFSESLYAEQPAPVAVVSISEAWEACGGNPGIKATRDELLSALRLMNEAEDERVALPSRETLRDLIAQSIGGDTYDCTRVWSAWGVGTMSEDDFVPVIDQEARLYEIADACLDEFARLNSEPNP